MEGLILNKSFMAKGVFLVWIYVISCGSFNGLVQGGDGWDSASHSQVYSSDPLLPCIFKGEMYFHSDSWIIDRDTECHCNDSDVICDVMTCPYLDCDNPVAIAKEPCPLCFHNVIAQLLNVKLHPLNDAMTANVPVTLSFDIAVLFEEFSQTTSVTGKRLWKVSVWGSSEPDGGGVWHGYVDQVLSARQSSRSHKKDTDFVIDDITFDLVPSSCETVRYICVSFARGDAPVTRSQLELIFTGTGDERRDVRKCVRAPRCNEPEPLQPKSIMGQTCRSGGREYLPGEEWKKSACVSCVCEDGQAICETERCLRAKCANPVQVEGVCCRVCPYMAIGRRLEYHYDASFNYNTGLVRYLDVDLVVTFREDARTTAVKGKNLWKMSGWASMNREGSGTQMMYVDQILDEELRSKTYKKGKKFKINNARYYLENYECEAVRYFCFTFGKGDNPQPDNGIDFQLRGINQDVVQCIEAPGCLPDEELDSFWVDPDAPVVTTTLPPPTTTQPPTTTTLPPTTTTVRTTTTTTTRRPPPDTNEVEGTNRDNNGSSGKGKGKGKGKGRGKDRGGGGGGSRPDPWAPVYSEVEPRPPRPCVTRSAEHGHGERWNTDPCTKCKCNDAAIRCVIKSCPPYFCFDPIFLDDQCCPFCPANVVVTGVSPSLMSNVRELTSGQRFQLTFMVNVTFRDSWDTTGVSGQDLWKLSVWTSRKPEGTNPANMVDQALTDQQREKKYTWGRHFAFKGVGYQLRVNNCQDVRYVCVKFGQSENPQTKHGFGFFLQTLPNDDVLEVCIRLPDCRR